MLIRLWMDEDDWIKIITVILAQWMTFETLISQRQAQPWILNLFIVGVVPLYMGLIWTTWSFPEEPENQSIEVDIPDFNISLYEGCKVSTDIPSCYNEPYVWYNPLLDNIVDQEETITYFDTQMRNFYEAGLFTVPEDKADKCFQTLQNNLCAAQVPICDNSCSRVKLCKQLCTDIDENCNVGFLFQYRNHKDLLKSVFQTLNVNEEYGNIVLQVLDSAADNCSAEFYEQDENAPCNYGIGYNNSRMSDQIDGKCTADSIIDYQEYLIAVEQAAEFDSADDLLQLYMLETAMIVQNRFWFGFIACVLLLIVQFSTLFHTKLSSKLYLSPIDMNVIYNVGFATKAKLFALFFISITLCYILRITGKSMPLSVFFSTILYISLIFSVYVGLRSIFLAPRIAWRCSIQVQERRSSAPAEIPFHSANSLFKAMLIIEECKSYYIKMFGREGKYEFYRFLVSEILEIGLQANVLFALAYSEKSANLMVYVFIISANIVVTTPVLLHPNPKIWRTLGYIVDSALELCYLLFLFFTFTIGLGSSDGLQSSDVIVGILFPAFRLAMRMHYLTDNIILDRILSDHHLSTNIVPERKAQPLTHPRKLLPVLFCSVIGILFSSFFLKTYITTLNRCEEEIGNTIWKSFEDHVIFPNGLFGLPSCNFESVLNLNLSGKSLREVPETLILLSNLEVLDMSNNELETLPTLIIDLSTLQKIVLTGNSVSNHLDWSNYNFTVYPQHFLDLLSDLKVLNLSHNSLSEIPDEVSGLKSLEHLDLSNNNLEAMAPNFVSSLESLKILDLSWNSLIDLSIVIWSISSIELLDLSYNLFTDAPVEWGLVESRVVHLKNNSIISLDWSSLEEFGPLKKIPNEISELSKLESFTANNQGILLFGGLFAASSLRRVELIKSVAYLPHSLCNATSLEYIDVSYSDLRSGVSISDCSNTKDKLKVKTLNVSFSDVTVVAEYDSNVFTWESLEELVATNLHGEMERITEVLFTLVNLKKLDIRNSTSLLDIHNPYDIQDSLDRIDLRGTGFDMDFLDLSLPDFNCSEPEYVCLRK